MTFTKTLENVIMQGDTKVGKIHSNGRLQLYAGKAALRPAVEAWIDSSAGSPPEFQVVATGKNEPVPRETKKAVGGSIPDMPDGNTLAHKEMGTKHPDVIRWYQRYYPEQMDAVYRKWDWKAFLEAQNAE